MTDQNSFASVILQRVGISFLLYIVLCLPSFVTTLYTGFGILGPEQYYDFVGSSLIQDLYYSELYIRLGVGWLPFLVLLAVIISSIVISRKDAGGTPIPGSRMTLTLQLFVVNAITMAVLAPIAFVGTLNNIGIIDSDAAFRFLNSDFIGGIYNHEYSWVWVFFPFLIASPIILSICAHAWYQPTTNATPQAPALATTQDVNLASPSEQIRHWDV